MSGDTGDLKHETLTCPKCGAKNLYWRTECEQCGHKLHPEDSDHIKKAPRLSGCAIIAIIAAIIIIALGITCFAYISRI